MGTKKKSSFEERSKDAAAQEVDTLQKDKADISEVEVANLLIPNRNELEKKFVRKLDLRLLPLMMLICMGQANRIIRIHGREIANR